MIHFKDKTENTGKPIPLPSLRLMSILSHNHFRMMKIIFSLLMAEMQLRPKPRLVS